MFLRKFSLVKLLAKCRITNFFLYVVIVGHCEANFTGLHVKFTIFSPVPSVFLGIYAKSHFVCVAAAATTTTMVKACGDTYPDKMRVFKKMNRAISLIQLSGEGLVFGSRPYTALYAMLLFKNHRKIRPHAKYIGGKKRKRETAFNPTIYSTLIYV